MESNSSKAQHVGSTSSNPCMGHLARAIDRPLLVNGELRKTLFVDGLPAASATATAARKASSTSTTAASVLLEGQDIRLGKLQQV